jgi:RNA polymerase-binding transcription factor DksA
MAEPDGTRAALAAARERALARLAALEHEFGGIVAAARDAGTDDEHDPEGATLAYERQHVAALADAARADLAEIGAALGRLADGSYGTCEACGASISQERLAARPAARTCVGCQPRRSAGRRPHR